MGGVRGVRSAFVGVRYDEEYVPDFLDTCREDGESRHDQGDDCKERLIVREDRDTGCIF